MNKFLILGLVILGALIIALLIEDSRDWLIEFLEYLISFEWIGDVWEFFTGMFENIGEFSFIGLIFAGLVIVFIYLLRGYMLQPFLQHMSPITASFWMIATYVGCGLLGYLVGKSLFDND